VSDEENSHFWTLAASSIVLGVLGLLFMICLCCGFSSLKQAIDVIDASADFLAKTKRIIFVPLGYFVITMIVVALWMVATVCVFAMAPVRPESNPRIP